MFGEPLASCSAVVKMRAEGIAIRRCKVYMVAGSPSPITLSITVDGKPQSPVTVQVSKMYTLFDSGDYADHQITIDIPKPGLHAFTFTFG